MPDILQTRINEYWSTHAEAYDTNQSARQDRPGALDVWARVWDTALPPAPADVLDLGTGSGNVARMLAGFRYDVTAIDLAPGMLARARRKCAVDGNPPRFIEADAAAPPFPPASFDALTARYLLWTLRDPDVALPAWREVLRPGGVLVAVDSLWYPGGLGTAHEGESATDRDHHFRAAYDDDALERLPLAEAKSIDRMGELVEAAGFTEVEITELPEVMDLDRRYGVAPGHRVQMQYRISARRPVAPQSPPDPRPVTPRAGNSTAFTSVH
ncbi:MAG TPA: class I SAM-dependent methyltransferase [Actinomycetaceae bacterium]|nr:class I SAM-dependent methyltransferase [Actinomycetaceae bacterium]